jgi:peptidyl-prolyl cis-trans isomerase SurA
MIPLLRLAVLAVVLGGCAIPSWVPWIGKPKSEPPPPVREAAQDARPEAPRVRPAPVDERVADRVIAVVNNDAITLGEVLESIAMFKYENRGQAVRLTDDELMQRFVSRLIDNRLQLQEAEREKIVVEDTEVEEELADRMKKMKTETREEFEAMLRREGIGMDVLKKRLRDTLRVQKVVRRKVQLRVSVTDQEIDRYLEANRQKLETGLGYHARHILVVPEGASDAAWDAARARAEAVHAELERGADFAELARKHSRDASARSGGDLGTLHRGELAQDIEAQILALSPGGVSAPYRSTLGYHIFRLESKESLEGEGAARAREQIRGILFREKYEARLDAWLKEIKQRAIIEVRL